MFEVTDIYINKINTNKFQNFITAFKVKKLKVQQADSIIANFIHLS